MIYLADHVVDVTRKKDEYPSPRHQFIKRNLRLIIAVMVCISVVIGWQVLHPFSILLFTVGCILAVMVAIHLLIVQLNPTKQSWYNNKELAIALIYGAGIYTAPIVLLNQQQSPILIPVGCAALLAAIAFINLLMASIIELKWDEEMDNTSLVRVMGLKKSILLFYALMGACTLTIIFLWVHAPASYKPMLVTYLAMIGGHWLIYSRRTQLMRYLAYRKVSEALFWLPIIAFFLSS